MVNKKIPDRYLSEEEVKQIKTEIKEDIEDIKKEGKID
jgi:hypothetical protein